MFRLYWKSFLKRTFVELRCVIVFFLVVDFLFYFVVLSSCALLSRPTSCSPVFQVFPPFQPWDVITLYNLHVIFKVVFEMLLNYVVLFHTGCVAFSILFITLCNLTLLSYLIVVLFYVSVCWMIPCCTVVVNIGNIITVKLFSIIFYFYMSSICLFLNSVMCI